MIPSWASWYSLTRPRGLEVRLCRHDLSLCPELVHDELSPRTSQGGGDVIDVQLRARMTIEHIGERVVSKDV
jgi:hypothetical protein